MIGEWRIRARALSRVYVLALVGLLALCALFVASGTAQIQACATQDILSGSDFEIDGIVEPPAGSKKNTLPTGGANLKLDGSGSCVDWDSVADEKQPDGTTGSNDNSFGQGTAENDPVPTIVSDSIPPNKSDLLNFGVFEEHAATKTFVALYWARINSPSGTTNMDFELNQNSCDFSEPQDTTAPGNICSSNHVTPARISSDKLVIFNLSSGGTVVDILLRTWNGSAWVDEVQLNSTGDAIGSINYDALPNALDNDGLGVLSALTFGEVIVDFQALLDSDETCGSFGSVYLKSRSSDSFNAELKDFIAPKPVTLTNCAAISTQASGPVTVGQEITDTATLANVSSGAGGTITFTLYAPGDTNCSVALTSSVKNVSGPGDYTSSAYTTTQVGTYKWIASYSGDAGNSPIAGSCGDAGESSTVNQASPTVNTTPSAGGTIGVTLTDSATLASGYSPTGTILFKLFPPSDASCTGSPAYTATVNVATGNGTYSTTSAASTTGSNVTNATGTWHWTADYSGDANNKTASSGCAAEPVTVSPASPGISTTPSAGGNIGVTLTDSATLSSGVSPTGTILFKLFPPSDANCTGSPAYTATVDVNGNGSYSTTSATSTTGSNVTNAAGVWHWTADYSGDGNNNAASSGCAAEPVTVTVIPSTIATAQPVYPNDTATVTGTTGDVTFELFGPFADAASTTCTGTPAFSQTVSQTGGQAKTTNYPGGVGTPYSVVDGAASEGWYGWRVTAAADATHEGRRSDCNEKVNIVITDYAGTGVKFP
jgi:hypothetical protein